MPQQDFLLKQVNKFFETLFLIVLKIEHNNIKEAEDMIEQYSDEALIKGLIDGKTPENAAPDMDTLKFQMQLLLLKYDIRKQKRQDDIELKENCIKALKYLIHLNPMEYDMQLHKTLSNLEGS